MGSFVRFENVNKEYRVGDMKLSALRDVSFDIDKGEICIILGQSGAGKTTILNILGGMDTLTSGKVYLGEKEISSFNKNELTTYRREDIGFVFQFYNLIPNLTAIENVEIVTQMTKNPLPADQVLKSVGLEDRMVHFPAQLSGGEQQRVAIARALAKNPKLLLCDEPTGALDYKTGRQILQLLQDQSRKNGMLVVIVTHNSALAGMADRIVQVKSGTIISIDKNENALPIKEIEW
ncbi:MAG TPA: macrolide ABC transporter ATP-binding protein [Clostridiales bacterium]|nr:macrolide ABC transporter ATP-binding protein [Clostridiales bacterium]